MKTGFQWTISVYIFLVVSMSSGQRFDHGSCVVLGSILDGSLELGECGAVEGSGWSWGSVDWSRKF